MKKQTNNSMSSAAEARSCSFSSDVINCIENWLSIFTKLSGCHIAVFMCNENVLCSSLAFSHDNDESLKLKAFLKSYFIGQNESDRPQGSIDSKNIERTADHFSFALFGEQIINHANVSFEMDNENGQEASILLLGTENRPITERMLLMAQEMLNLLSNELELLFERDRWRARYLGQQERLGILVETVPAAIFEYEEDSDDYKKFHFISPWLERMIKSIRVSAIMKDSSSIEGLIDKNDFKKIKKAFNESKQKLTPINLVFKAKENGNKEYRFFYLKALPKFNGQTTKWYGTVIDVSRLKQQEKVSEELLFDFSHYLRRPSSNIQGLTSILLSSKNLGEFEKGVIRRIERSASELDMFIMKTTHKSEKMKEQLISQAKLNGDILSD